MQVELTRPDMLVGRHSEADIRLPLPDVSRRHCRFLFVAGSWQVHDLNSLNGVFVNDQQVQQTVVHSGDRIRIGGFTFTVEIEKVTQPDPSSQLVNDLADNLFKGRFGNGNHLPPRQAS
jgi:pSer/pThr/pTyr-binding forkhead associated (FHA) protein